MTCVTERRRSSRGRQSRKIRNLVLMGTVAALVAGCNAHAGKQVRGWVIADPSERHPIHVDKREALLEISVPRGADSMTHQQRADAYEFVANYKSGGEGRLVIRAPSGSPNEIAAMRAVDEVRRMVRRAGISSRAVHFEPYTADGDPFAAVRMSYERIVAIAPKCGHWPKNLGQDPRNLPHANFGCAQQRNLAHMVADPRDLLGPRQSTPRSSERRDVVWDKYIKGETTITERSDEEKAKVSEVQGGGE